MPLNQGRKHAKKRMRKSAVKAYSEVRRSTLDKDLRRNTVKSFWQFEKEDLDWWSNLLINY
jgi:hypothetical protein